LFLINCPYGADAIHLDERTTAKIYLFDMAILSGWGLYNINLQSNIRKKYPDR
jgi:hypothetical protein